MTRRILGARVNFRYLWRKQYSSQNEFIVVKKWMFILIA